MGNKLYVGNLPYSTTGDQLETLFATCGDVQEAVVIMDRDTGRSKGFGFVTMGDDAMAAAAEQKFNGTDLDGRTIKVSEAKPRPPRNNSWGGGGNRDGGYGNRGGW